MNLSTVIRSERFYFADLREVFAKANEEKSGDQLAGLAARTERERIAAKFVLADLTLEEIVDHPLIDPDADEVSRLILESHDREAFASISQPDRWRVSRMDSRRCHDRRHAGSSSPWTDPGAGGSGRQADEQQRPGAGRE